MSGRREGRSRQVSAAGAVVFIAGWTLLAGAVAVGIARDSRALPAVSDQLRLAVIEASALMGCLEGVQDEQSAVAAQARLDGCDIDVLRARVASIDLPPEPPLSSSKMRHAREAAVGATEALRRFVLEADAAIAAMREDIRTGEEGPLVAVAFRAAALNYHRAVALQHDVALFVRATRLPSPFHQVDLPS